MIDLDCLDCFKISEYHKPTSKSSSTADSNLSTLPQRDANLLTCMLITANVGTIFDDSNLLELWFQQFKSYLANVRPQLVAIHCQEVGGKNYETSERYVRDFTDKIIGDESIDDGYSRVRIFIDENFGNIEKFTALGCVYLVHDSVQNVKLYNFKTAQFERVEGRKVHNGFATKEAAETVEIVKFPEDLFPESRWSRKGYMRTRWLFNDSKPLDFVNIHLFHDSSNLVAMEQTPSPYAQNRQRALEFTLKSISHPLDKTTQDVPLFIFGDFNFRLDTSKVIQRITEGVAPVVKRCEESNEVLKVIYHRRTEENDIEKEHSKDEQSRRDDDGNSNYIKGGGGVVMTVGKKLFDCENLDETFRAIKNTEWLKELDCELDKFKSQLYEFKISFSPSYPFREDAQGGHSYMKTRCPAWCDRILFNAAGSNMIYSSKEQSPHGGQIDNEKRIEMLQSEGDVTYRLMGNSVPMGDHKPVLLYCRLDVSSSHIPEVTSGADLIESTAM